MIRKYKYFLIKLGRLSEEYMCIGEMNNKNNVFGKMSF